MSVQESAAPPKRRRKAELPQLPLKQHKHIFGGDIPRLAAQEGRKSPGNGTIQKMTSRAGREAGLGPKVAGFIGKRPVYEPQDTLDWLDSLVTPEPRVTGITLIGQSVIESAPKAAAPIAAPIADSSLQPTLNGVKKIPSSPPADPPARHADSSVRTGFQTPPSGSSPPLEPDGPAE